jgi:hypothetical protein
VPLWFCRKHKNIWRTKGMLIEPFSQFRGSVIEAWEPILVFRPHRMFDLISAPDGGAGFMRPLCQSWCPQRRVAFYIWRADSVFIHTFWSLENKNHQAG